MLYVGIMKFRDYLSIQKHNVNDKLSSQASQVYDHGVKIQLLEDALRRIDHQLELKQAQIFRSMAQKYQAVKAVTATRINSEVTSNPEIIELKEKKLDIQRSLGIAKIKMKALEVFSTSLVAYSNNIREEKKAAQMSKL